MEPFPERSRVKAISKKGNGTENGKGEWNGEWIGFGEWKSYTVYKVVKYIIAEYFYRYISSPSCKSITLILLLQIKKLTLLFKTKGNGMVFGEYNQRTFGVTHETL